MSLPEANAAPARRVHFKVGRSDVTAPGVLAGAAVVNHEALIRYLRDQGLGAEVDAILAKEAAGGYANKETTP